MDTDSEGQRGNMVTVAMFTEPTRILHGNRDKVFHGDLSG